MREKPAPTDTKIKAMKMAREKEVVMKMREKKERKERKASSTLRLPKKRRSTAKPWLSTSKVSEQSATPAAQRSKHVSL